MHRKTWLLLVATAVAVLSLGVVGCGGDDDEGEAGGDTGATSQGPAADQTLTIAWGAEPPSLDPGKATDTTSSNVLLAIMDPLVKLNPDTLEAEPALAESWDVDGKERHVPPAGRRHVDERRPGHRSGLRVLVEADAEPRAGRGLRLPALRDRGRRRVQRLHEELRRARRQGGREGRGRPDARGDAHVASSPGSSSRRRTTRSWPSTRRPSSSSATTGRSRATSSRTARSCSSRGITRRRSTS